MSFKRVEIGSELWGYEIEGLYTHIFNEDGETVFTLRWAVKSEDEVRAGIYGYGTGLKIGKLCGESSKLAEIQRVLCIPNTKPRGDHERK